MSPAELTASRRVEAERAQPLRVLMVTGAYFPELSGGGLQARALARALASQATFTVVTTSIRPDLPAVGRVDGIPIYRIYVDPNRALSNLVATLRLIRWFLLLRRDFDIVNLHGFSRKAIILRFLCVLCGKPFALTLQTGGHDEPAAARRLGRLADWAYRGAALFLSVSPGLSRAYLAAGLDPARLHQVCNAVDTARFKPADEAERQRLREELGLPRDRRVILFVGFFSRDKRPDLLFEAWSKLPTPLRDRSSLVFVGATGGTHLEVEADLADRIRETAARQGLGQQLVFVESTLEVDKYFRASDVYVLPSIREGLPISLLEAMACGLPCIATDLSGSTDVLIESGRNGTLVPPDDAGVMSRALIDVLSDPQMAGPLGMNARRTIEASYAIDETASKWLDAYRSLAGARG